MLIDTPKKAFDDFAGGKRMTRQQEDPGIEVGAHPRTSGSDDSSSGIRPIDRRFLSLRIDNRRTVAQ